METNKKDYDVGDCRQTNDNEFCNLSVGGWVEQMMIDSIENFV